MWCAKIVERERKSSNSATLYIVILVLLYWEGCTVLLEGVRVRQRAGRVSQSVSKSVGPATFGREMNQFTVTSSNTLSIQRKGEGGYGAEHNVTV